MECSCNSAPGQFSDDWTYHADECHIYLLGRIKWLEYKIDEAKEIYTGMDGFMPETAPEGYCLRIIEQMYRALILESY